MNNKSVGILCGFEAEAAVARKLTPHVAMSGAVEALAFERAENLVKQGANALISFGVAGGLTHDITSHHVVVAKYIAAENGERWNCDTALMEKLKQNISNPLDGGVFGSTYLVPTPEAKKKLHTKTQCIIVDMESHVVAKVATKHGIPFAVLRGVSDAVEDGFPDAALKGLNPDGSNNMNAVYKSILRNPMQIPALLKLFKHTGIALRELDSALTKMSSRT